jgi:hypothetical protein
MPWEGWGDEERHAEAREAAQIGYTLLGRPKRTWKAAEVRRVARALWMATWTFNHDKVLDEARQRTERAERRAVVADANVDRLRHLADQLASVNPSDGMHGWARKRIGMDMLVALGVPRESVEREYGTVVCSTTDPRHCPKHGHCTCPPGLEGVDVIYHNPACPLHGLNNTTHPEEDHDPAS